MYVKEVLINFILSVYTMFNTIRLGHIVRLRANGRFYLGGWAKSYQGTARKFLEAIGKVG